MPEPARVLLVDDHAMFRDGVKCRLESEPDFVVAGEASTLAEARLRLAEAAFDVLVIDVRLPDGSGITLARECRAERPRVKILVLTAHDFDQYVTALVRSGIEGYLLKDAPLDELVRALREIRRGGVVFPPAIASKIVRTYRESRHTPQARRRSDITARELEILECLAAGLRNREIGERLAISPRTVDAHVTTIFSKLGATSRTEAVRLGQERGLIR